MPIYPNRTPFKRAVSGIIESEVAGDALYINNDNLVNATTVVGGKSGAVDYLTTDYGSDDACIQAAINYVHGLGGGSVLIREGTYIFEDTVTLPDNILLSGVGYATIFVLNANTEKTLIRNTNTTTGNKNITVQNLKIDGNKVNQAGTETDGYTYNQGIHLGTNAIANMENIVIKDVWVVNTIWNGCVMECCNHATLHNIIVDNSGRNGIYLSANINSNFSNIVSKNNTFNGFAVGYTSTSININNIYTEGNGVGGVTVSTELVGKVLNSININNHNSYMDNFGLKILEPFTSVSNIFWSGIVKSATLSGVLVTGGKNIAIRGVISNCGGHGVYMLGSATIAPYNVTVNVISHNNIGNGLLADDTGAGTSYLSVGGIYHTNDIRGIRLAGNTINSKIHNAIAHSNTSGQILYTTGNVAENNDGFNPVGNFTAPSIPASTVNYTNTYGYPCQVQVYGGTVTEIDIDDIATGLTAGVFIIPPGGTINIIYSAAPSWRWWGL